MLTKLPVKPTAFGTVMLRKKVARPSFCAAAAIRSVRDILNDMDAVVGDQEDVDRDRQSRVLGRPHFDREGIGADQHHLLIRQPLRGLHADARLGGVVDRVHGGILQEQILIPGVEEDSVTFAQRNVIHLQAGLKIGRGDQCAAIEAVALAVRVLLQLAGFLEDANKVDDDAAGGECLDVLEAKLFEAVLGDVFPHRRLIIIAVLDADMAHAVEMGADVALAEPGVFHVSRFVLTLGCAGRQARRRQDVLREAGAEQGNSVHEDIRHRNDFAGLDLCCGRLGDRRRDTVARPGLVIGPKW